MSEVVGAATGVDGRRLSRIPDTNAGMTHILRLLVSATLIHACGAAHAQRILVDDSGHRITLSSPAQRIVALAPHVTELVYAAGAGDHLVGVVDYSNFPPAAKALPRVGGYSRFDLEAVAALKPDLVIAWKSGNAEAALDRLRALGITVYINESRTLDDVARSLRDIGTLAGTEAVARTAAEAFMRRLDTLRANYSDRPVVSTFYQIWHQPLMTINDKHLISDVIRLCGGRNAFASLTLLAPKISEEAVVAADPEVIVASGMGEARPEWLDAWRRWPQLTAVARDNLFFIPPDIIQRHTPRILDGAELLCGHLEEARTRRP